MSLIVLYFLHSTSVLSFYIVVDLTLSIRYNVYWNKYWKFADRLLCPLCQSCYNKEWIDKRFQDNFSSIQPSLMRISPRLIYTQYSHIFSWMFYVKYRYSFSYKNVLRQVHWLIWTIHTPVNMYDFVKWKQATLVPPLWLHISVIEKHIMVAAVIGNSGVQEVLRHGNSALRWFHA